MSTNRELIACSAKNAISGNGYFGMSATAHVYSMLQILRSIDVRHVTPEHAYVHARLYKNAPLEKTDADRELRNKYLSLYKDEITDDIAKCALEVIMDLSNAILTSESHSKQTVGLIKPLYDQIKRTNWTFREYAINHDHESIMLSLRLVDLTEPESYVRADMFTFGEVIELFRPALLEFIRPVKDRNDLMHRTTKIALGYTSTILAIVYGMLHHLTKPYDKYLFDSEELYGAYSENRNMVVREVRLLERYPIRTPEGAFVFDPRTIRCSQSIERPVEIMGDVDLFLLRLMSRSGLDE